MNVPNVEYQLDQTISLDILLLTILQLVNIVIIYKWNVQSVEHQLDRTSYLDTLLPTMKRFHAVTVKRIYEKTSYLDMKSCAEIKLMKYFAIEPQVFINILKTIWIAAQCQGISIPILSVPMTALIMTMF